MERISQFLNLQSKNNETGCDTDIILFRVYDVKNSLSAWPQPGDLLCKNRNGDKYTLSTIQHYCISHCDIVVSVDKVKRIATTICGNIKNRVNKTFMFLTPEGLIDKNVTG